jgi:excisionase family DNA binding protein
MAHNPDKLFKTPEAAKYLGISKKTLLKYCAKNRIGYHRYPSGAFYFRQSDLGLFLARTYVPSVQRKGIYAKE